ncbi:RNA-binding cell elongation regulator Jag/EloR [Megasphaera sp. UPII 135-E]|uniref:RNA-binding cell elongation regulator Jag/EloR n=1 Tax=Megasphaera sp. UPII 135-E TaxID=1000569 RepID=UPI00021A2032|nr:putative protein jag [Megasphaera sp. UPII 135-E]
MRSVEGTGKTIDDAIRSGLVHLGLIQDEVDIEILEEPKSGFLGFGSKLARVRLTEKASVNVQSTVCDEKGEVSTIAEEPLEEKSVKEHLFTQEEAATKAKQFVYSILKNMGVSVMIEKMIKSDKIILSLHGQNLGFLIGKHGQTLDALQYLTNLTTNQGQTERHFIMLDIENYRSKREDTLRKLALRLAKKSALRKRKNCFRANERV